MSNKYPARFITESEKESLELLLSPAHTFEFKVKEEPFIFHFALAHSKDKSSYLLIRLINKESKYLSEVDFESYLPYPKYVLMRKIASWLRDLLWHLLTKDTDFGKYGSSYSDKYPDKELRKLKSYVFLRAQKISSVLGGKIWKDFIDKSGISDEHMKVIQDISFRLNPIGGNRKKDWYQDIFIFKRCFSPDVWNIFKSDMLKYNVSLCKYIINTINTMEMFKKNSICNLTTIEYCHIIMGAPLFIKRCRYGFEFDSDDIKNAKDLYYIPTNRWQWFTFKMSLNYWGKNGIDDTDGMNSFLCSIPKSDIKLWHYYKKCYHISGPYSFKLIAHIQQIIYDGMRQYKNNCSSDNSVSFVPVDGSPMRMMRNAIYNHRQELELSKKGLLAKKDFDMPIPPIKLPQWMEDMRIKTAHAMIRAGIECEHCIGGYTDSHDFFVRDKTICAQIDRDKLEVIQCYDYRDSITKESEKFKNKINKALLPFKEMAIA